MKQPPWYKDPLNLTMIVAIASIMVLAYTISTNFYAGGGHDHVPFPREKHIIPWTRGEFR